MEKPTTFKSVKTVFTFIKNIVSDIQNQFEKRNASLFDAQLQPLFVKATTAKTILGMLLFLCFTTTIYAQIPKPFKPRLDGGSMQVKGDILLIGNSIVTGQGLAVPYNGGADNNAQTAVYIDIDGDPGTFSSSSANLLIDNSCKSIAYAGLYWASCYPNEVGTDASQFFVGTPRLSDWNQIKFKVPGSNTYEVLTADNAADPAGDEDDIIFDGYHYYGPADTQSFKDSPIICYKNVTKQLQAVKNGAGVLDANGTYTVADIRATRGKRQGGSGGGWTLVVIYESPSLPSKFISVFDGYAGVQGSDVLNIPVSGFKTLPGTLPVYAKIGVSALEGDRGLKGDSFQFRGGAPPPASPTKLFTKIWDAVNPKDMTLTPIKSDEDNFFNSSISKGGAYVKNRNPNSENTLGFDIDNVDIDNTGNKILGNSETQGALKLTTNGDGYGAFLTTFAVDIIEPKIVLTKVVRGVRADGVTEYDLNGADVTLGQEMRYEVGFQNVGNDNAKTLTITDILPQNVIFNRPSDIIFMDNGISVASYNAATRTIVFNVDDKLVVKSGSKYKIIFRVKVVADCNELVDACSNKIQNTATSRYFGTENPTNNGQPYGDGSYSFNTGCLVGDPTSTNFLVGISDCLFQRKVSLCGSAILKAANGYTTYVWKDETGKVVGTTQQITVIKAGVYTVQTGGNPDCKGILQTYTVEDYAKGANDNPVSPYASNIDPATKRPYLCANDNKEFPKIFLCGLTDTREIKTNIAGATSIKWQVSTDVPPTGFPASCAYEDAVNWTQAAPDGPNFTANKSGAFRVIVSYGNNCVNTFYFSVFQNPLDVKAKKDDVTCSTPGKITVTNPLPNTGYTYSINGTDFQTSNVFDNLPEGNYEVTVKQTAPDPQTSSCPFTVKLTIVKTIFSATVVPTDALCKGSDGTIRATANQAPGDYQFIVKVAGTNTVVENSGKISFPNYKLFTGLAPGKYDVEVYANNSLALPANNGCFEMQTVEIFDKSLTATYKINKTLACGDGEFEILPTGGTLIPGVPPSYNYNVNGVDYGKNPKIPVIRPLPTGGIYNVIVTDYNNCTFALKVTIPDTPKPTVDIKGTDGKCYGDKGGQIDMVVTPTNSGYAVSYNVNNGAYTTLPTTNLAPGTYDVIVKYTYGAEDCFDAVRKVVIGGAADPLTASAGVAELSGCGPPGNVDQGMVRITNPQGGIPFPAPNLYRYSFDGGITYITDNFAWVNPKATPYTLYIKDAAGCVFPMEGIILEPKPSDPVFIQTTNYTCDGKGTTTVTVKTDPSTTYEYEYYLGTALNTNVPPNVFKDLPVGTYDVIVKYKLVSSPTFSNLLKEDFGSGPPTKSPGIAAAYCFNDQRVNPPYQCKFPNGTPSRSVEDNAYSVASFFWRGDDPSSNNSGAWFHFKDHTTNPNNLDNTGDPDGRFLLVNIGNAAGKYGILYSKPIVDVIENQDIIVDFYVGNLLNPGYSSAAPIIRVELIDALGNVVARDDTGEIAAPSNDPNRRKWVPISIKMNPGNNKNLTFVVRSGSEVFSGNDLVLDDIWVRQLPKSCLSEQKLKVVVEDSKGFTAEVLGLTHIKCNGSKDGAFSIIAKNFDPLKGFYYTIDGGANWVKSTVAQIDFTGKDAGLYDVRVRYDDPKAPSPNPCIVSLPTTIKTESAFSISASPSVALCKDGATVTASATGGVKPYTLTLTNTVTKVTTAFPVNGGTITGVAPGSYTVSGTDANLCPNTKNVDFIIADPVRPEAEIVSNTGLCFDGTSALITVNITKGVGPFYYQVNINGAGYGNPTATFPGKTFTYTATATGTYDFLITDTSNKCDATAVSQKIEGKLTANALTTTPLSCDTTAPNAVIEVSISGGYAPYKYVVKKGATTLFTSGSIAGPKFTYSTSTSGTYTFEITDVKNCPFKVDAIVNSKIAVTAKEQVTNVSCNGAADGSVTITPLTGVAPFKYQFNGTGAFTSTTTYGSLAGSIAGTTYTYIVQDAQKCEQSYSFKVFQPDVIKGTATMAPLYNCDNPATITVSGVSGGNGSYQYTLLKDGVKYAGPQGTLVFNNLSTEGVYTVTITDSKSCSVTIPAGTITKLNPPAAMTLTPSKVTCPSNTASVTISDVKNAAGVLLPTAGLQYRMLLPTVGTYQTSNVFTGLAAGVSYKFEVKDANNCKFEETIFISALPTIAVTFKSQVDIVCFGDTNGSAIFTVTGLGNGTNYSYVVDTRPAVTGTSPATGTSFDIPVATLSPGLHTITVTNTSTTCSAQQTVTILAPTAALALNAPTLTHVTCNGLGQAVINAVGGWTPYKNYELTPVTPAGAVVNQTTNTFTGLAAGDYKVVVTDLNGCTKTQNFTINPKVNPTASIDTVTSDFCSSALGATIKVTPNAAPNYTYTLGSVTQNNGTFTGLIPGSYIIKVTDTSTGCFINLPATTIASPIAASITLDKDLDCSLATPGATIRVYNITAGYPDYKYRVNTTGAPFTGAYTTLAAGQTSFTYPAGAAATYYFEITDSKNCTTVVSQKINAIVKPVVTAATPAHVKCKGDATGTVTVTTNPAAGTYTYVLTPTAPTTGAVITQTNNVFTGIKAGTYSVTVTDAKSCISAPLPVTITEPAIALTASALATKVKCGTANAPQAATITVTAINGTPFTGGKYKYDYGDGNGYVDSNTFTTSTPGLVSITVIDKNGCTAPASATINTLNPPTALAFAQANVISCDAAQLDTDLKVTVTNGVAPFKFEITSTTAAIAPATPVVTGITTQDYTFANLSPGKYFFRITDDNGCIKDGDFTIDNVVPITVSGSLVSAVSCNNASDGSIKFNVGGNSTGFTYVLKNTANATITGGSQAGNVVTFTNLPGGTTYTITVTNPTTKCTNTAFVNLANPTAITITAASGTKVYCDKPNTAITVTATGGTGTLYYAVVSAKAGTPAPVYPADYNTTGVFSRNTLVDGETFNVFVRDAKGCPATTSFTVVRDAVPTVDPIPVTCYKGGSLTIVMSGTVFTGSTIAYGVNGVYSSNPSKTISGPGTYNLTVKDANGCISAVFPLIINNQLKLTVKSEKDVTCTAVPPFTTTDAQVTLSASGGGAAYTYWYKLGLGGTYVALPGNVFNTSAPGDYYFQVTSDGCSAESTVPVKVTVPVLPVVSAVATGTLCTLSKEGTIKVTVTSGGVGPFKYTIDNWVTSNDSGYFTDLPGAPGAGLGYTYQVRDAKGCIGTGAAQAFVIAPDPITFDTAIENIECDPSSTPPGSTLGSITVINAAGGTGQYTYHISNNFGYTASHTTTTKENWKFDIIDFGIYTVEVRDANSCSVEKKEVMASPPNDLVIDVTTTPSTCTTGGTATVTAVASVGSGNYEFGILEFNTPPYSNNYSGPDVVGGNVKTFNPLIPGVTYTFVVHDLTTNCYFLKSAAGPIPSASTLVGTPTPQNVTCKGLGDGRVTFTITGQHATTTSVDYQIFRDQDNAVISPLLNAPVAAPFTVTYPSAGPGTLVPGRYYIVFTERGGTIDGCQSASTMFEIKESTTPLTLLASSLGNANCNPNAGIVTAQGKGGAGSYLYQIITDTGAIGDADDPKPTAASFLPIHSTNTFFVNSGDYLVWVKDANNCITSATVKVIQDPLPVFNVDFTTFCAGEGAFEVTVNITDPVPTMGPYKVSVDNGTPVPVTGLSYTALGLNSGPHTFVVIDKNNCSQALPTNLNINATPSAIASIGKVLACSVTGTVVEDAVIHVEIKDGTPAYTYEVKKGIAGFVTITPATTVVAGVTAFDYAVPSGAADTYIFRITDVNGCPVSTNAVTIEAIVPIVPAANPIQPLCFGGTGTIVLSATGGQGPYRYNFNNLGFSTNDTYTATASATAYPFIVKDNLGCEVSSSVILGEPTEVNFIAPVITPLTCGPGNVGVDAQVVLSASGGTGTIEYSFNGSDFSTQTTYNVIDTGSDQLNIPFSVRDANSCSKSGTVDILKLDPPVFNEPAFTQTTITCLATTSDVQVVSTNGIGTSTYKIISPVAQAGNISGLNSGLFTGLPAGDYIFEVTDSRNCKDQAPYTVKDVIKINVVEQSTTGITCATATDGKATFFVSGFGSAAPGTYHYILDTDPAVNNLTASTINLTGLSSGNHTLTVYDDVTGCSMALPLGFDIAAPPAPLSATKVVTPLGCTTFGAVTITAVDGWGDYTYTLTQGATVKTNTDGIFAGLTVVGTYNISVKDSNGCEVTDSFSLTTPVKPTIAIDASNYCYVNDNTTTINVSATSVGTPHPVTPYEFSIDGTNWQTSGSFTDLKPGDYTITVRDKFGCTDAITTKINGQLFASAENRKDLYCAGLAADGTIRVSAVGGYPAYTYTVNINGAGASAPVVFTNPAFSDYTVTAAGSYVFTVYDSRGCAYPIPAVVMLDPTPVVFTAAPTSPSCSGTQGTVGDGSILFNLPPSNNNPDYRYTIQRTVPAGGLVVTQVNNPLFKDLIAGTYTVTVTSGRDCPATDTVIINPPTPVVASYLVTPFKCSGTNTLNATVVTVTGTGGKGTNLITDYTYSDNGSNWKTTNTFNVIDNGSVQNPVYYVKDGNGCIASISVPVNPFPKLISATATLDTKADCKNAGEIINVVIAGGSVPANFEYDVYKDGILFASAIPVTGNTFDYTAPDAGHFYQFKVIDKTTDCFILSNVYNVPLFNTMKVIATASQMVSCNGFSDAEITVSITNYTGAFTYQVYDAANTAVPGASGTGNAATGNPFTITGLPFGDNYTVRITQTAYPECTVDSNPVDITQPPVLSLAGLKVDNVNQNCNNDGAVLTVDPSTIVGGTPGFMYAFAPAGTSTALLVYTPSPTKTIVTTKVFPLFDAWDVYVKDAKGCFDHVTVNVSLDPKPTIKDVKVASQCDSASGYRIDVTATGVGTLQYSLDNGPFTTDNFFIVYSPGQYTVTVQDANQCTTTALTPVTVLEPLTLSGEITVMSDCNTATGEITLHAEGGTVLPANSYVYTKDNWVTSQVSPVFTDLAPAVYKFKVRDIVTLCEKEFDIEIEKPTDVTGIILTPTAVSCKDGLDGTITVAIATSNNNPVYTYSLTGPAGFTPRPAQESPVFKDLPYGLYTVTVLSGRGCSGTATITVAEPAVMAIGLPAVTQYVCNTGSNAVKFATITVTPGSVVGGSGNYLIYEFFRDGKSVQKDDRNTFTEFDYLGGTYTVTVYDSNNCQAQSNSVIIAPYADIDDLKIDVTKITCKDPESIQVTAINTKGTLPALDYTIEGVAPNTYPLTSSPTGLFAGLNVGQYKITVTNPVTGCSIVRYHTVNEPNTFKIVATEVKNLICFSDTNGSVTLTLVDNIVPSDEAGVFSYVITHESGTQQSGVTTSTELKLANLIRGKYTVAATLVNTPFCPVTTEFSIEGPAEELLLTPSVKQITCADGNSDGIISVSATGGWPGEYQYKLEGAKAVPYSTVNVFENLAVGSYVVFVKDINGCEVSAPIQLDAPKPIDVTVGLDKTKLLCYDDTDATLTVNTITGGSGNYTYTLHGTLANGTVITRDAQPDKVFAGLGAGTYFVTVSDDWTCVGTSNTVTVDQPNVVEATIAIDRTETCAITPRIILKATGGTGPYFYSTDGTTYNPTSFVSQVTIDLPKTTANVTYKYFVKDSNDCNAATEVNVEFSPVPAITLEVYEHQDIQCRGSVSGSITAIANGGLGNYVYILTDVNGNAITPAPTQLTPGEFTELAVGKYRVTVQSLDCEQPFEIIEITQPDTELSATLAVEDVKCNGFSNGKITVNAVGGTGAYVYALHPNLKQFFDSNVFDNLKPGIYTIRVQDANGCYRDYQDEVKQPDPLDVTEIVSSQIPEYCFGDKDGVAFVEVTGGVGPYMASITGDGVTIDFRAPDVDANTFSFQGLSGGIEYHVIVKDLNECTNEVFLKLPDPVKLNPIAKENYSCENDLPVNNITVEVDASIDDTRKATIVYTLFEDGVSKGITQTGNPIFRNLPTGNYSVQVVLEGCERMTNTVRIDAVQPLNLIDVTATVNKDLNIIEVKASGGVPAYEYNFNDEGFTSSNTYRIYKTGEYSVVVRDQNGCEFRTTVKGTFYDFCLPNYFTPDGDGRTDLIGPDCGALAYKNLTFDIFDRYGRVVAKYHVGEKWDGRYNGAELPTGDYWYVLKLNDEKDPREFVGHFTLYR
ncbi:T9SS type B sorting domain-containing protein [Flavobacterium cupreum]|nr:T9SS type B sorting domain-containing protein [Flavobacterium cupreum]